MKKTIVGIFIILMILGAFVRCATISAPKGGPKDSIPPVFVGSNPKMYSSGFKNKKIALYFNESVQLKDQQKYFFMSPQVQKKPLMTAKGKLLEIEFENPLDSSTTYSLDFGPSVVDVNENNPIKGFRFVFSTGQYVDSLIMNGQVINASTRDSVNEAYIFFFDASLYNPLSDSTRLDSLIWNCKADAVFRSDSSGCFIADILKDKEYRIYALVDKNGNQLYEAGTDLIGFSDSTFNPKELGGFSMYYDTLYARWNIDSIQSILPVFLENPKKKQLLLGSSRPKQNQIRLVFNERNAVIDTLTLEGIPQSWQMPSWSITRDTLTIWIKPPTVDDLKALPDTISAHLVYERTDSAWHYYPYSQDLKLKWKNMVAKKSLKKGENEQQLTLSEKIKKYFGKRKLRRMLKKAGKSADSTRIRQMIADSLAKDSIKQKHIHDSLEQAGKKIKISVNSSSGEFVPLTDLIFSFESPLDTIKSDSIKLWQLKPVIRKGKVVEEKRTAREAGVQVPFDLFMDSTDLLKLHIKADWSPGDKFSLYIPKASFHNILDESNDSLAANFVISTPDHFGTLVIKPVSNPDYTVNPETRYIYQIVDYTGAKKSEEFDAKVVRTIKNVLPSEEVTIQYLDPGMGYRLRVIEDSNGNGIWDTGVLETHKKPEEVRVWRQKGTLNPTLVVKQNWTIEIEMDYKELFK